MIFRRKVLYVDINNSDQSIRHFRHDDDDDDEITTRTYVYIHKKFKIYSIPVLYYNQYSVNHFMMNNNV